MKKKFNLTGLSLWKTEPGGLAQDEPEFFAALAPVSRGGTGWCPCLECSDGFY